MVAERILQDYVNKAETGERLPTETEFADLYKVSVPTVREALRSLVQVGHLRRRQGSGTYKNEPAPARATSIAGSSKAVALISPLDLTDGGLSCHYVQSILQTAKHLRQLGLTSQVYFGETAPDSPRTFDDSLLCEDIAAGKISAAFVVAENSDKSYGYRKALEKHGIPALLPEAHITTSGTPVMANFLEESVDALMRHGRRKIACIGFGANRSGKDIDFREIVGKRGGITDDSWIIGDLHPNTSGSGYSLMREIWTTGKIKPDGLVLCDDVFFQDTAMAIQELGIKSPEQLLVVTYHNKGERLRAPFPFIEIQHDARELASQIADNIVNLLRGQPTKPLVSDPTIVDPLLAEDSETLAEV